LFKLNILYEDQYIIAVEKPAGVLAYPLPGSDEKTIGDIYNALPIHRLDRDTSGIILLAKSEEVKEIMQKLFKERQIEKTYTALVCGKVEPKSGEIKIPLGRGSKDRLRVVPSTEGRESHTTYSVEKYFEEKDMSLLRVGLKTGRTHQIRVHFSAIGHPVVGDKKYSKKESTLKRQFLHATEISFIHPYTHKLINLKSPLPKDLKSYLLLDI
jgi:23S rRNA pseudouridine1911/1915/1917 synthase